jgi:hypothetical protein
MMRGKLLEEELSLSGDPVKRMATLETRRKAAMDLAKLKGLLRDKVDLNLGVDLKGMPFRELLELARGGGADD